LHSELCLLDQELFFLLGRPLQKSQGLHCFKWDWDKIWQDCSASKYASIDGVGSSIWRLSFKNEVMTWFHVEKCSHLVNAHVASAAAFASSWSTVLSYLYSYHYSNYCHWGSLTWTPSAEKIFHISNETKVETGEQQCKMQQDIPNCIVLNFKKSGVVPEPYWLKAREARRGIGEKGTGMHRNETGWLHAAVLTVTDVKFHETVLGRVL